MSERTENVRANKVGYGRRQKGGTLLPVRRLHRVHHPERQRRLEYGDAHVGERDRAGRHQYVRILNQCH